MNVPGLVINKKVVDNNKNNLNLQYGTDPISQTGKKWQKVAKKPKIELGDKNSIWRQSRFFLENMSLPFCYPYVP